MDGAPAGDDGARRERAAAMRRSGLSEPEIAERLGVGLAVVRADVNAYYTELGARLALEFSSAAEVAEARAEYAWLIGVVKRELMQLERTPGAPTAAKVRCVRETADLIDRRVGIAASAGLFTSIAAGTISQMDANTVWQMVLARERLGVPPPTIDPEDMVSVGERKWLGFEPRESADNKKEKPDGNS
jgi:hypothetical protein